MQSRIKIINEREITLALAVVVLILCSWAGTVRWIILSVFCALETLIGGILANLAFLMARAIDIKVVIFDSPAPVVVEDVWLEFKFELI